MFCIYFNCGVMGFSMDVFDLFFCFIFTLGRCLNPLFSSPLKGGRENMGMGTTPAAALNIEEGESHG